MPRPLSFDHLQAILRQYTTDLPDVRTPSPNTRYTIHNAALGAWGIFLLSLSLTYPPESLRILNLKLSK